MLPRLAVDVGEAAQMLGVSRDFFDERVRDELRWVRRGRLKLVAIRELEAWFATNASRALEGTPVR